MGLVERRWRWARGRLEGKLEAVRQIKISLLPVLDDSGIATATGLSLEAVRALV